MAADEFAVRGEGDVALDDSRAHARGRHIGLARVLRELKGRAAMSDRESAASKGPLAAGLESVAKGTGREGIHQVVGARTELDAVIVPRRVDRDGGAALRMAAGLPEEEQEESCAQGTGPKRDLSGLAFWQGVPASR